MIDEAVRKATAPAEPVAPADEPLTAEAVQELIAKAMEPLLKARGLPSNLGGDADINKSGEGHYLAGIL